MKFLRTVLMVPLLTVSVGVGMAHAACAIDARLGPELASNPDMQAGLYADVRRDVRKLRNAAENLRRYGREDACKAVVDAIRSIARNPAAASQKLKTAQKHEDVSGGKPKSSSRTESKSAPLVPAKADGKRPAIADEKKPERKQPRPADDETKKRLASAKSIAEFGGMIRSDEIVDADVFGPKGEEFGEVADIVLGSDSKPAYALIAFGGWFGIGEDVVAIPFEMLKVSLDRKAFFIPLTEADLEDAPKFKRNRFDWLNDKRWRARLETYFLTKKKS